VAPSRACQTTSLSPSAGRKAFHCCLWPQSKDSTRSAPIVRRVLRCLGRSTRRVRMSALFCHARSSTRSAAFSSRGVLFYRRAKARHSDTNSSAVNGLCPAIPISKYIVASQPQLWRTQHSQSHSRLHRDAQTLRHVPAESAVHHVADQVSRHPRARTGSATGSRSGEHRRLYGRAEKEKEGGSVVCRTQESDRIASSAFAAIKVCAGAVLPGRNGAKYQTAGSLPQPSAETKHSYDLIFILAKILAAPPVPANLRFRIAFFQHPQMG
jgi:hypothetical protein